MQMHGRWLTQLTGISRRKVTLKQVSVHILGDFTQSQLGSLDLGFFFVAASARCNHCLMEEDRALEPVAGVQLADFSVNKVCLELKVLTGQEDQGGHGVGLRGYLL